MVLFGVGPIVSGWLGPGLLQRDFHVCMLSRGVCLSGWSEGRYVLVTGSRCGDGCKQSVLSLLRTGLVCLLGQPFCLRWFYFLYIFAPLLCPLPEWPNPALLSQLGRGQPTRTTFSAVVKGLAKPLRFYSVAKRSDNITLLPTHTRCYRCLATPGWHGSPLLSLTQGSCFTCLPHHILTSKAS
jgi:hypothetical protein